jgi:putrescine aminotransferase
VNDDIGYAVASGLFKRGVLISGTLNNSRVIRVEPPLVITYEEIDTILNRLEDTLQELRTSASLFVADPAMPQALKEVTLAGESAIDGIAVA